MEPERRGRVIAPPSNANPQGEERTMAAKPFDIPKRLVWNAWRLVRANAGAAGVDEESIELFERDLRNNLYRIWNRMSSGSYFPPPREGSSDSKEKRWSTPARDSDSLGSNCPDCGEARA